jgi:hypothetical protein
MGLLTALRVPLPAPTRWLLAPGTCLAGWAALLGVTISIGWTVRQLVVPFWIGTLAFAIYGIGRARHAFPRDIGWLLGLAVLLPIGLMPFDFLHGLANFIGGPVADGWSYVARGQELWAMPKDSGEPWARLAPLHQYASHLRGTRFIASALLGILSPFAREAGDTQAATGAFLAFSVFVFASSCLAIAKTIETRTSLLVAACTLAVFSRWVLGAIQIHNYDNLLEISFLPITMALIAALASPKWNAVFTFGLVLAAAVYVYPEMAVFNLVGAALACARRAAADRRPAAWILTLAGGLTTALVLLAAGVHDIVWFISNQAGAASAAIGQRPGEGAFAELGGLVNWWGAVWGLTSSVGTTRFGAAWETASRIVGTLLWILALIGGIRLVGRRLWDVVALGLILCAGGLFMVVHEQYSYGAYKFLLLGNWILALFVVSGATAIAEAARGATGHRTWRTAVGVALAIVVAGLAGSTLARIVLFQRRLVTPSIRPYRNVQDIDRVIGRAPVILAVTDPAANEWAVYFLRAHPMRLFGYQGPMAYPHVAPLMDRAAAPELRDIEYVLTDAPVASRPDVLWQQGPYALSRIAEGAVALLPQVNDPDRIEQRDGQQFYWAGHGDTELEVYAASGGEALFFGRFLRGPGLPEQSECRLAIGETGAELSLTITRDGDRWFSLPVHAGNNRIYLRAIDSAAPAHAGETRPRLLGIEGLRAWLRPAVISSGLP